MVFNVVENEASAWNSLVASDDAWPQQTTMCFNVSECNVEYTNFCDCWAVTKWIEHATEST